MTSLNKRQGFTLIELVIVLAIAALILAGVLLAVSGAQRTQRDNARKNIASRIASALENYASNNNGAYPTSALSSNYTSGITDPDTNAAPVYNTTAVTATNGIRYASNVICSGGAMTSTNATVRNYAITYWSENAGASQCLDNK